MFRLDNRTALVTGVARGLGAAIARVLASQGARLALVDVRSDELQKVTEECGAESRCFETDVSNVGAIRSLVADVERAFKGIDILVNNAGICPRLPFADSTEVDWDRM